MDPDPYRWIAKKERPDFRQKHDKRNGKNEKFTGAQGNAAGQAETKLMLASVPLPKAPRLPHLHRLDPEIVKRQEKRWKNLILTSAAAAQKINLCLLHLE